MLGRVTEQFTPRVLATFTFLGGLVLLFSGATPASDARLAVLGRVLPLQVIEASHFLASVAGAGLLLLSQGLARRLDGAYYLASALLILGITTSLLKGFDYEEAALLCSCSRVLWRARPAFDRRAAFFETRFSAAWMAAVVGAVAASMWLGLFAFQHVDYSRELWWQFELQGDASRFLRASVGAAVVLLLFGFARLIGYAPHEAPAPTEADLRGRGEGDCRSAVDVSQPGVPQGQGAAVRRRRAPRLSCTASRDGPGWLWAIRSGQRIGSATLCDCFSSAAPISAASRCSTKSPGTHLHRYADFGLTFVKLGEEAKVDLTAFTLEGGHGREIPPGASAAGKGRRRVPNRRTGRRAGDHERAASGIGRVARGEIRRREGLLAGVLRRGVSSRFPIAVIERDGRIQAFANLWPGRSGSSCRSI